MSVLFIINPMSGTNRNKKIPYDILSNLRSQKEKVDVELTEYENHATELAEKAVKEGIEYVVAYGGDGTVNEIAKVLVNTDSTLGIIPAGSGNGLARHLGIPLEARKAAELILKPNSVAIDSCFANSENFFCTAGLGFEAEVSHSFAESNTRGLINYAKIVVSQFKGFSPKKYIIKVDGKEYKKDAFSLTIANAGQYGNNVWVSPKASIVDGLVDVCILRPFPTFESVPIMLRFFTKSIHESSYMEIIRGKSVEVLTEVDESVHLDGEPKKMEHSELKFQVLPKSLKVLVPA